VTDDDDSPYRVLVWFSLTLVLVLAFGGCRCECQTHYHSVPNTVKS
jgi:hypothetical protein